jgi:two-component system response regulator VanR
MKKRILLVDDDQSLTNILNEELIKQHFSPTVTNNGIKALRLLKSNNYDLVLLDLLMPELGGFDVIKILRTEQKKLKIIVISNLSSDLDINKAKELGADEYLVKTEISLNDVIKAVKKHLSIK